MFHPRHADSCYPGPRRPGAIGMHRGEPGRVMADLTAAADLAWRIAALEARRGAADAISPEYLTIGLLSLEKLLDPSAGLAPDQRTAARAEQAVLAGVLDGLGLDPVAVRRAIRQRMPAGS